MFYTDLCYGKIVQLKIVVCSFFPTPKSGRCDPKNQHKNAHLVTMHFSTVTTACLALLALGMAAVRGEIRIEDLRKRRPLENAGLAVLILNKVGAEPAFAGIVSTTGALRVPVDREKAQATVDNVHGELKRTDENFARGVRAHVRSVLAEYNMIAYRYLFKWRRAIEYDPEIYDKAFGAIEFCEKSDGFGIVPYLHDAGLDSEPILDNLLLYDVPVTVPGMEKPRPVDLILRVHVQELDHGVLYKYDKDFKSSTARVTVELSALETKLHRISYIFSGSFCHWLWNYRSDDHSGSVQKFADDNFSISCRLWVSVPTGCIVIMISRKNHPRHS